MCLPTLIKNPDLLLEKDVYKGNKLLNPNSHSLNLERESLLHLVDQAIALVNV